MCVRANGGEDACFLLALQGSSFIRCLKPNPSMAVGKFVGGQVLSQLRCAGGCGYQSLLHNTICHITHSVLAYWPCLSLFLSLSLSLSFSLSLSLSLSFSFFFFSLSLSLSLSFSLSLSLSLPPLLSLSTQE